MKAFLTRWTRNDSVPTADEADAELATLLDDYSSRRYRATEVNPWTLTAARVALWGAVALGAVCGVASLFVASGSEPPPPAPAAPTFDFQMVPAPVAGVAEEIVADWLVATDSDDARVAHRFVERAELPKELPGRTVRDVTAISGEHIEANYWSVTVAADISQALEGEEELREFTWYVEIGIVGDPAKSLAALRTPSVMPLPFGVERGWASTTEGWEAPREDDPLAQTLRGFLAAMLTGEGDPGRYLASGADVPPAARPAPLHELVVDEMAVTELEDGRLQVQVRIMGTTVGDIEQPLAYEVSLRWNKDRYEVVAFWGAATPAGRPDDE